MTDIHEDVLRQLDPLNKITPSEESTRRAISRTRSALLNRCAEDEFTEPQRDRRQWRWNLFLASCIAASLTVIALLAFHGWRAVAFADVQKEIAQKRTVRYIFVSGSGENRIGARHVISGTRERVESLRHTRIRVPDQKIVLHIDHENHTAVFRRDNADEKSIASDPYTQLASIAESSVKEAGKRTIDGILAIGFEVPEPGSGEPMMVWVNPRTRLPVRIEASGTRVLDHFAFDAEVPENMFRLTVPEGYTVEN